MVCRDRYWNPDLQCLGDNVDEHRTIAVRLEVIGDTVLKRKARELDCQVVDLSRALRKAIDSSEKKDKKITRLEKQVWKLQLRMLEMRQKKH